MSIERRRLLIVAALSVLVAITRLLAVAHSIWDWDEGLFISALRDYDVASHHPHPPGFPLFIAVAKLFRVFVHDDFHALRGVNVISSFFVFPSLYAFARALTFPFRTSIIAALLFSFLPNVWFWGGTAFSDVFAIVLFLAGAALLLRGSFIAGSILFAATLLVRPQNVLLVYPWFLAARRVWRSGRAREVIAGAAIVVVLVLGGYGIAARVTGWRDYIDAVVAHQRYVATIDGSLNPIRPPIAAILRDFAVDPFHAGRVSFYVGVFAIAAFLRPARRDFDVLLTFAPNFIFTLFLLSVTGISRLSLGYMPAHALLAADGMALIAALLGRREVVAAVLQSAFAAAVVIRYIGWIQPSLDEVRRHDSPPVAAMRWLLQHAPRDSTIYFQGGMVPYAAVYLTAYRTVPVSDSFDPQTIDRRTRAFYVADGARTGPDAINFRRPLKPLWYLSHRRNFAACVVPSGSLALYGWVHFDDGWYGLEPEGPLVKLRWMSALGRIHLEPIRKGQLTLHAMAPLDSEAPPVLTIAFDGREVDRFRVTTEINRSYDLDCPAPCSGELVLAIDHTVVPARVKPGSSDTRELGLRVDDISWKVLNR